MKQFGSPSDWLGFIDSQVPSILRIVIDTWDAMNPPYCNEREDPITESFVIALRRSRDRCELPFRIDIQSVELEPAAGEDQGRMDIVFSPMVPREDIYFCLECKRINVCTPKGIRPYFAEYIVHGMMRFIRGQYAKRARYGGMAAYVLDGNLVTAQAGIEANLRDYAADLGMEEPIALSQSAPFPKDSKLKETIHCRHSDQAKFQIQHVFLLGDPKSSPRP